MEKNALGQGWLLGETIITGIGQGYIQTTPIQLCLMTAQIGNGGYKIYPKIVFDDENKKLLLINLCHYMKILKILKLFKMQCLLQQMK